MARAKQRISIDIYFDSKIKLNNIELSDPGIKLRRLGFRFDKEKKVILQRHRYRERPEYPAKTIRLNGTIDASITAEHFMSKVDRLKGVPISGVKFWDYKYPPYPPPNCCTEGLGFITDEDGRRFLGKRI